MVAILAPGRYGPCLVGGTGGFSPACTECANFLARATGVTSTTDKTNYCNLICGLVTDAVWSKLDALYIFAAVNAATARLNLVSSSFGLTEHGTVTFSAYNGFTGDGSTGYEDTGFVPPSAGGNYARDSASFGFYNLTGGTPTSFPIAMGTYDGTSALADIFYSNTPAINTRVNTNGFPGSTVSTSTTAGLYVAVRTASNSQGLSKNGAAPTTSSDASVAITNLPSFFILGRNDNGTPTLGFAQQLSAAFIGGALTNTDIANLSSRVNTYMTAYGINVY